MCTISSRMPGERLSIRDNSAVGRFHGVSASNGHAVPEKQSEAKEKENGCRRWLRKACPCCFRRQSSSYDITAEVDGGPSSEGENESPSTPLPLTVDTDVDGKELMFVSLMHITQTIHDQLNQMVSSLVFFVISLSDLSLKVCSVNLLSGKSQQNRKEHHTDQYHGNQLVIRRGQTFQIELDLSRPFNLNTDKLHLELKTGQYNAGLCLVIYI